MKSVHLLCGAALVVATAVLTTQVVSQDHPKGDHPKGDHPKKDHPTQPPQMTPEQQAEMQKYIEFATPGPAHEVLKKKVGTWNGAVKHWMDPKAEPMTSSATATIESMWDGRYYFEHVEGEGMMPGETFEGRSASGYDNLKKKYFWVWLDNMGTGIMTAEGTYDAATKTFNYTFDYPDPVKGKYLKGRSTEKWVNDDTMIGEMYGQGKDGKEYRMMEITYTRKK